MSRNIKPISFKNPITTFLPKFQEGEASGTPVPLLNPRMMCEKLSVVLERKNVSVPEQRSQETHRCVTERHDTRVLVKMA